MEATFLEIVDYWIPRRLELELSIDWAGAAKRCWRCAQKRKLQRCHIIPRALGGPDCASNLVLLCAQCHLEAPNVAHPDFMWTWLRAHAAGEYGTYWVNRGFREYEFIFGKKPYAMIATRNDSAVVMARVHKAMISYMDQTTRHWGQGQLNAATWAWLIRSAEEEAGLI